MTETDGIHERACLYCDLFSIFQMCVARCPLYSQCAVDTDCAAGVCRESVCRELTPREKCTNGEQDNFETDVDCGGSLCQSVGIACDDRRSCVVNADCTHGLQYSVYSDQCLFPSAVGVGCRVGS